MQDKKAISIPVIVYINMYSFIINASTITWKNIIYICEYVIQFTTKSQFFKFICV